ncbi:MAG: hypothetical protein HC878_20235 [Leptolyngbyaceae cyanobacterium SL_5_14]|nr:hypothetical protein [Leptolyngbyaceae cyanobacterium SL_5_14]
MIAACRTKYIGEESISSASEIVGKVLDNWLGFEQFIVSLPANSDYFSEQNRNFNNYYKARNVNQDISNFFEKTTSV